MRKLTINVEALKAEEEAAAREEGLCDDGVRVGALHISSTGLTTSLEGPSYVLSLDDLVPVEDARGTFLGQGSSGSVRRLRNRRTGEVVAIKEIKLTSAAHLGEIRRELETLYTSEAVQPTEVLVSFYGAFSYEGSVFIAMECLDGSLDDVPTPVPHAVLSHLTRHVLEGLVYLHRSRHLIHRDLKPSNILFRRVTGEVKISDFGVSSVLEGTAGDANSFVGTVTYMSPERLRGDIYSYAADVWSLGLVVAELALGFSPYEGLRGGSSEARFWALLQHLGRDGPALELPDSVEPNLADFIEQCVRKGPADRPTCEDLMAHSFITMYNAADCAAGGSGGVGCAVVRDWLQSDCPEEGVGEDSAAAVPAVTVASARREGLPAAADPSEELDLDDALDKLIL